MSSVHPELHHFDLDREGSTWQPRTELDTSTGSSPRVKGEIDNDPFKPQL